MGLMRDFVTIASELRKEPHSLPTAQAVAAEANSTQMLRSPPAETEQNQKLGGTSIYSNFSFTWKPDFELYLILDFSFLELSL